MANIKSALKRIEITKKRAKMNASRKSAMKTAIKRFEQSLVSGEPEQMQASFKQAVKSIDSMASKGLIHKNTAARKKSSLQRKLQQVNS
ncbi:MAG: 30S ribosomal protein S20 [Clostridia bacterium]|jgi:small subunit ribosomal protein S20|nr:30S ribosomal protein S20 [Clostridia bacterium]